MDDSKNPIGQVYRYVEKINDGKARDQKGRPLLVSPGTPFYVYILCDKTPGLERVARHYGFTTTPDGLQFFTYNQYSRAWVEIITYDKVLQDARKRNRAPNQKDIWSHPTGSPCGPATRISSSRAGSSR